MEPTTQRAKAQQLADDFSWLEEHCRKHPELVMHSTHLRLAGALTRNVLAPAIEQQPCQPIHVAVVGGAGAGKSTVVNFLAGQVVADANPQAGYTRHPTAFLPANSTNAWPSHLGFLGPLRRLGDDQPANLDQDVYQVKRLAATPNAEATQDFVFWDCPDMTTWAAAKYVTRLIEIVGLADIIIYVASDERYNDEIPTEFLHLVLKAGKPAICCLTKARASDVPALTQHFRQEVLGRMQAADNSVPLVPVVAIPQLPSAVRNDPNGEGQSYRYGLLNQIFALVPSSNVARQRTIKNAISYLETAAEGLLEVARRDLAELNNWHAVVQHGRSQFEERYRSEFLSGEEFRRFDATREQVLQMLELPGPGKFFQVILGLMRAPYQYLRKYVSQSLQRPRSSNDGEKAICEQAMSAWLDYLHTEVVSRATTHPFWKQLAGTLESTFKPKADQQFVQQFRHLEVREVDELEQTAQRIPEKLATSPILLLILRLMILLWNLFSMGLVIYFTWIPEWYHLVLLLLVVSMNQEFVEFVVRQVVEAARGKARDSQMQLFQQQLTQPLAHWFQEWPATAGTSMEKLQSLLQRVPRLIQELTETIQGQQSVSQPTAPTPVGTV